MKGIIIAMISPFLLAACQQEGVNSFKIEGLLEGSAEGDTIAIEVNNTQDNSCLQKTTIHNQTFEFEGIVDSTLICNITYQVNGNRMGASFFLEKGKIVMDLTNETSSITGTPLNDSYQHFLNKYNSLYAQIGNLYNDSISSTSGELPEVHSKVEQLQQQALTLVWQTIERNIQNPLGFYLFSRFNQSLSAEQQMSVINRLPLDKRRTPLIEEIRSQLAILPPDSIMTQPLDMEHED